MSGRSISSLDLYKFLRETKYLDGGFVRNVKSRKNELYILIFNGKEYWLRIAPGAFVCVETEKPEDTTDFPFTGELKSVFNNRRVNIAMHGSDRILEIIAGVQKMVVELFSKGNVILVDGDVIKRAMFSRDYASRSIKAGEKFVYPPGCGDVFNFNYDEFKSAMKSSDKESVVKALAIDFVLGGMYAEEICYRASIDKNKNPYDLDETELNRIYETEQVILKEESRPNVIDDKLLSCVEMTHLEGDKVYFDGINAAIKAFFAEKKRERRPERAGKSELTAKINEYSAIIDFINGNYGDAESACSLAKNSALSVPEREKGLSKMGWKQDGRFLYPDANPAVRLDITKSMQQNLSDYYEKAKRLKRSVSRRVQERKETRKLKYVEGDAWYSKFRWFRTSDNKLVVMGRDVNQNASLIEKHVDKNDIVLHAEIFGSPFGVIKLSPGDELTDRDKKESAGILASYSSAWRAGAGSLDVYLVGKEQVTKTPPTGESLKKGAFYIEGKREYVKGAELGIFISINVNDQEYSLSISPCEPSGNFILVRPGNKGREEVLKRVLKIMETRLGVSINKDRLDRLLPQGKCTIEKIRIE